MKNSQKGSVITLLVIVVVLIIGGGIFYSYKKNNWGCALDSQGTKRYVLKSDLQTYKDKIEDYNGSQFFNDHNIATELRTSNAVYAEDSNNCYGKHVYRIKKEGQLNDVSKEVFNQYLTEKFNNNLCENGALIQQSGNSPYFVKNNFCTI